jgi:anti-sigma-K factor RskA
MNYRDPELRQHLAADYVSGAMRGGARRRFEGLMAADAALRREVREWEGEIYPLVWSLAPQMPPGRVWRGIQARLPGRASSNWGWGGLYAWRLLSAALALVLAVGLTLYPQQVDRAARAQLMAVLQTSQARAVLVVRAGPDGVLHVRTLEDLAAVSDGRAMELWVLPPGQKPRSAGLLATNGATALARPAGLTTVDQLAVSLEPPGGSPTGQPTGPVVMTGKLLEL